MHDRETLQESLLKRNRQVPRYTSYPTAPHFSEAVTGSTVAGWLEALDSDADLSLYFHIPFCRKMCWYCGCNTKATKRYSPVDRYLDYLFKEIEMVSGRLSGDQTVRHIHFGGGSPSMLKPTDFERLMATIRSHFSLAKDAEIAIELDPREITEAKVAAYALAGVTRASLGVQDFHEDVQVAINRRQPFHVIYDAVNLLKAYGIKSINMDLLYGLPHQTEDLLKENVDFASALGADRISLFGYAHVPWMKKHMRLIDEGTLPDGPARLKQFDAAKHHLEHRGYVAVGLDHFVLPRDSMAKALEAGTLKRNFQGYTTDAASTLIGFGASAISSLPQGYAQNTPATHSYFAMLDAGDLPTAKGKAISDDDRIRRQIIEHLMCYFELDLISFCEENGVDIGLFDEAIERLQGLKGEGLVSLNQGMIRIPREAQQAVRLVCAAFDSYLTDSPKRHAQVA
ncbi:oxygen-independent coproporphyrinogen III oxidase [Kordiimonas lacus]|uniref:Coproporphyrinogen-III oxidase n=1 Tax=Kordiimonas lacus TaxID=637679 RepID=A0A1G6ZFG8_9PROT|nr:oxygen-independent coproporphyrinogen III oxidase [Kordiimonas lacus]SDE01300.1 oxygen-independent coproporphyrinogen-3 oxidase [Kordiimonas lacus]